MHTCKGIIASSCFLDLTSKLPRLPRHSSLFGLNFTQVRKDSSADLKSFSASCDKPNPFKHFADYVLVWRHSLKETPAFEMFPLSNKEVPSPSLQRTSSGS